MDAPATTKAPSQKASNAPSNPPPQKRAMPRSVTGSLGSDPAHVTLSPLLTGRAHGSRAGFCIPVFVVSSF